MDKKDLELILNVIRSQSATNHRIEHILTDLVMGGGNNPQIKDLRNLITQNQSLLSELEKKMKESGE